jgi:hypothetical protein
LLIITGTMGAGKSAVLAEASDILAQRRIVHAAIDLDVLGLAHLPNATPSDRVMYDNLRSVVSNYAALGVQRFLVARAIENEAQLQLCRDIIPAANIVVCRLSASIEAMERRVQLRESGILQSEYVARVAKLQEMGCNSLRTSHNPPTPELLDACDQMGMLVFDETRMMSSNPEGLSQFENLVRRDRNHPSVFMWSMGNEEGQANGEKGVRILTAMKAVATKFDGTRPVSIAPTGAIGTGGLALGEVAGYNYMDPQAEKFHKEHPDVPVMGTETVSAVCTRGIYVTDPAKGFVGSYDPYTTTGRASAEGWWSFCNARPWLSGGFVWTGFDYRGEPSPNGWPNISSQYGIIDMCGFPKDSFFYYQSWWTGKTVLHLFPHWNWPGMEGKEIAV